MLKDASQKMHFNCSIMIWKVLFPQALIADCDATYSDTGGASSGGQPKGQQVCSSGGGVWERRAEDSVIEREGVGGVWWGWQVVVRVFILPSPNSALLPSACFHRGCLKKTRVFTISPWQMYMLILCPQVLRNWVEEETTLYIDTFKKNYKNTTKTNLPDTSTMSPGTISLALIICTLFLSER